MIETFKKEWQAKVAVLFFVLLLVWWLVNNFVIGNQNIQYNKFGDFSEVYGLIALWGGIWGVAISRKWGGLKSLIGKAVLLFSFGLFFQEFGQLAYAAYFDILGTPGPYPSIGDLGFFGSIPLYTLGVIYLAKASGVKVELKSFKSVALSIVIPVGLLVVSYLLFLQGYKFDWSNPLKIFLDFGYPFGQAIYISLAILTYLLSKGILGGVMKSTVLSILFALVVQFVSDYTFLYQSSRGTWKVGEINDFMYFVAYFLMAMSLFKLQTTITKLRSAD